MLFWIKNQVLINHVRFHSLCLQGNVYGKAKETKIKKKSSQSLPLSIDIFLSEEEEEEEKIGGFENHNSSLELANVSWEELCRFNANCFFSFFSCSTVVNSSLNSLLEPKNIGIRPTLESFSDCVSSSSSSYCGEKIFFSSFLFCVLNKGRVSMSLYIFFLPFVCCFSFFTIVSEFGYACGNLLSTF